MTLVEVAVAVGVLAMLLGGILTSLVQMRRQAAASVAQNTALTIVQGYIEQIKNIPLQQFVNSDPADKQNNPRLTVSFALPTLKDQNATVVPLLTTPSTVALYTLTGAKPGVTPNGVVDNLQSFDLDSREVAGTATWATIWPGANSSLTPYPTTIPGKTDLRVNFWVQISDLTPTSAAQSKVYSVVIVYTWQYLDGAVTKYRTDSVRTLRSAVQTF
jgi:type II secretory pathway pseudopilin PulG